MAQMLENPQMQQMMQQMLNDPNTIAQMSQGNPQMAAALQNPQMRQMLANPQMIQAALRMQSAMGGQPGGGAPGGSK
jgi:ubiquilin